MDIVWRVPESQPYLTDMYVGKLNGVWNNQLTFYSFTGPVHLVSVISKDQVVSDTDQLKK